MIVTGGGLCQSSPPRHAFFVACELTKQGRRFLSSLVTIQEPSAAITSLRKFVASSAKHTVLTTLSHILSSSSHPRLSSLALPLYSIIEQESWFIWNAKLVADLISFLCSEGRCSEAEILFDETVSRLMHKERDLCAFYCSLIESHAKQGTQQAVIDSCLLLSRLISQSSSVYVKQRGYESMVGGYCKAGLPDKAERLVGEMKEKGLKSSVFEFRSLILSYGQMGFLQEMNRIIVQMEDAGIELDTVSCNMVLSSYGARYELSDMFFWLKKMRSSGTPFSIRTYNTVLNSCPNITLLVENPKDLPLSIDELVGNLSKDQVNLVLELLKSPLIDEVTEWKSSEMKLDLHGMHLTTAYLILLQWFRKLKQDLVIEDRVAPTEIVVVCGRGKHSSTLGQAPVKELVKTMMIRMKCPLRIDWRNVGSFVVKGKNFKNWLLQEHACNLISSENGVMQRSVLNTVKRF